MKRVVIFLLLLGLGWWWVHEPEIKHPPGVLVSQIPLQGNHPPSPLPTTEQYNLSAVADYDITARVLGLRRYHDDKRDLVPYDLAVGWGRMSDQAVLDRLTLGQSMRFFFYSWTGEEPLPQNEIICSASNMHLIPKDKTIREKISDLKSGMVVRLKGQLCQASRGAFHWNSSMTRDDTGNGACELMWVDSLEVLLR